MDVNRILPRDVFSAGYSGDDHDGRKPVADIILNNDARACLFGLAAQDGFEIDFDDGAPYAFARHQLSHFQIDVLKLLSELFGLLSVGDIALRQLPLEVLLLQLREVFS